ncbi:MAG TPA: RIP metalloprotease RseP [Gammaproteobacteria bacterium]|nr:RIP metalloprotease RseP [Gammaproteobacteria bacterium]
MSILTAVVAFIAAICILVTIHEYGHFWVARRLGVKILRFSIGFGQPLWKWRVGRDQTELTVAAIPLGGYVKMLDEREGEVPAAELHRAFNRKPLLSRALVVLAGPLANFLFAMLAYTVVYVIGVEGIKPVIGEVQPGSPAALAGLQRNDEIVAIDDEATPTWGNVIEITLPRVLEHSTLHVRTRDAAGEEHLRMLPLDGLRIDDVTRGDLFKKLGFEQFQPVYTPVIQKVLSGGAAARAGLQAGDRLMELDGRPLRNSAQFIDAVAAKPDNPLILEIERQGRPMTLTVTPQSVADKDKGHVGRINAVIAVPEEARSEMQRLFAVERYGVIGAVHKAWDRSWQISWLTLKLMASMIRREASLDNISGPISIAQYAGRSLSLGAARFLEFMAFVSISLFVLNLLPVPLLDGGHLMYYLIEFVVRRPLPESVQAVGQQVGLVLLLMLMGLAFYNDILRLWS